jgi:hypothetical protein
MDWKQSDAQGEIGVAITHEIISRLRQMFRRQELNDVGIDAHVELVDERNGQATGLLLALQIKCGPSFLKEQTAAGYVFRGEAKHLDYWGNHSLPVVVVLVNPDKRRAFWAHVSHENVETTGKGWKLDVPFANEVGVSFLLGAKKILGVDATHTPFTILELNDTSNTNTKRYSVAILVQRPFARLRLEAAIRHATTEIRKERYHRTDALRALLQTRKAEVVSLYVAGDPTDVENANWLCRSIWVNQNLAAPLRPQSIGGVDLGDGLEVVWNSGYAEAFSFYRGLQIDKQSFIDAAKSIASETQGLVNQILGAGNVVIVHPDSFDAIFQRMRDAYFRSGNVGIPPYECRYIAERFADVMALADNAFIYCQQILKESGPANGAKLLLETTLRDYGKNLDRLGYELDKMR